MNINILYEIVEKDSVFESTNFDFDDEDQEALADKICKDHDDRVRHFYCQNHKTIFCRECIKEQHSDEECFVVDLYEIQRMRQLMKQNLTKNEDQSRKRIKPSGN